MIGKIVFQLINTKYDDMACAKHQNIIFRHLFTVILQEIILCMYVYIVFLSE